MRVSFDEDYFDIERLKDLILYVADRSADDPKFGATKLNKILFFCDFLAYAHLGKPITGATYQKLEFGPAPRQGVPAQQELIEERKAVLAERNRMGRTQKRLVPLRPPQLSRFTADEIALIDEIISELWDANASQASDVSHSVSVGWQIAEMNEEIPYSTVFLSPDPLTEAEVARAQRFAAEHGFLVGA